LDRFLLLSKYFFIFRHIKSGFVCAIKKIHKNGLDDTLKNQLIREIKIQMFLNHPNIVKLYTFFSDKEFIYLVMELCISGQLYDFIRKQKYLEEDLVRVIIRQISQGLDYIHENKIIHRDLKPENILYQNVFLFLIQGMMKICDFGWSIDTKLMR
jgi:serine/threonine protein kinase